MRFYTEVVGFNLFNQSPEYGVDKTFGSEKSLVGGSERSAEIKTDVACDFYRKKGAKLAREIIEFSGQIRMQTFLDFDGNMMQIVLKLGL